MAATPWYQREVVLVLLVVLSVVGLAPFAPLFDVDEGAFTEATREMLSSGNWVSTYLNGEPRHDKPILIYWLQAVSATVLGFNEFALRLPSMLCAFGWVWLVWRFTRDNFSAAAASMTVWVMAAGWLTPIIFKAAIADALLNLLLSGSFFAIYRWYQRPSTQRLLIAGAFIGLAFLTKGPIAIVLPLGSAFIALAIMGQLVLFWRAALHPASWLTVLVIITPWHVASYFDQGTAFFEGFYLGHNLGRFGDTMEGHGGHVWYYLLMVPLILLPWIGWLPALVRQALSQLKARADFLRLYLLVWFLLTFTLFSFSSTQLPHYLLYGLTPIFILLGEQLAKSTEWPRWRMLPAVLLAMVFALFPLLIPHVNIKDGYLAATLELGYEFWAKWHFLFVGGMLAALAAWIWLIRKGDRRAPVMAGAGMLMLAVNYVALPVVSEAQQAPVRGAGLVAKGLPEDQSVVSWAIRMPSFSVYANRVVPDRQPQMGDVVFTRVNKRFKTEALFPDAEFEVLYKHGGVVLLEVLPAPSKKR